MKRAAVFLDRDGVINRNVFNAATQAWESPLCAAEFELMPDAMKSLKALSDAGFLLFLVSNQPNYAKGKASLETLAAIHQKLLDNLSAASIAFSAFYYCLHHPQGIVAGYSRPCVCRKPSPYFLLQARDAFDIDMERSWMIGDRDADIACGSAAGVRTILVLNDAIDAATRSQSSVAANAYANGIVEATAIILHTLQN